MKIIKAINKTTGKIRYFGSRSELKNSEVGNGASKFASQIISRALAKNSDQNGFNGWKLYTIEIDDDLFDSTIEQCVNRVVN